MSCEIYTYMYLYRVVTFAGMNKSSSFGVYCFLKKIFIPEVQITSLIKSSY